MSRPLKAASSDGLARLVESFFLEHLQRVRGASPNTVLAYRDALRLFFNFLADTRGCPVTRLRLTDLRVEDVLAFLTHIEAERGNSPATRNYRLAAIRSFFNHLIRHDPTHAEQYCRVAALPAKKSVCPLATYLEPDEVRAILQQPDRSIRSGVRDYALLMFLYNTGARISEALAVTTADLVLAKPFQVRLHGKGGKERICPLWRDTVEAVRQMCKGRLVGGDGRLFLNLRGEPITRDGAAYVLSKYVTAAAVNTPTLSGRTVTPHVLRHSCAVALLQAGVDITVIRDYLGHATVATTNRYVSTNLQMKRDVLEAFWKRAGISSSRTAPWRPKPDLLAFLQTL